jgi:hypothetical protein
MFHTMQQLKHKANSGFLCLPLSYFMHCGLNYPFLLHHYISGVVLCKTLLIKLDNNLGPTIIGLLCRNQICSICCFPFHKEHRLSNRICSSYNTFWFQFPINALRFFFGLNHSVSFWMTSYLLVVNYNASSF